MTDVDALFRAAADARPGDTITLEDGHYPLPSVLELRTDGLTVRSLSGDRTRVVLDGVGSPDADLVSLAHCRDVTVRDLTITNGMHNGFKLDADLGRGVQAIAIDNCVIRNVWQRGIKCVPGPPSEDPDDPLTPAINGGGAVRRRYVDDCTVSRCLFVNDRPKRIDDDPYEREHPERFDGNYLGGIDAMAARDWQVADNVFVGIRGRSGMARGAIFFWQGSARVHIEGNTIIDCDSGLWLGLATSAADTRRCREYRVRRNLIAGARGFGMLLDRHAGSRIEANVIGTGDAPLQAVGDDGVPRAGSTGSVAVRAGHENESLAFVDNVIVGAEPAELGPSVMARGNLWLPGSASSGD